MSEQAQIDYLEFPESVRTRRGMYIVDKAHTVFEIVDNSVDEHAAGHCDAIAVAIVGKTITVEDNGRGIPVTPHKDKKFKGLTQAEVAFTTLHAGGKFGKEGGYTTNTGGMNGVGASCVNALSDHMTLSIKTGGSRYEVEFEKGIITKNCTKVEDNVEGTGTTVTYTFDEEIWGDETLDLNKVKKRMRQLAYLNPGLLIYVYFDTVDANGNEVKSEDQFYFPEGLKTYVEQLTKSKQLISEIAMINETVESTNPIDVQIAYAYTDSYSTDIYTFVNNVATENGGDHLTGFKMGVAKAIERYSLENKIVKTASDIASEDTQEGIVAIVSIKLKDPLFEGQGKSKIKMSNVRTAVRTVTENHLYDLLEQDMDQAKRIVNKTLMAAKARIAAKKARESARSKKEILESTGLPGKLADCQSKKAEECEIYLVEGDSAAGTAKQGRDRRTQAILPVFGKVLNVEKARVSDVLKNVKLTEILKALGCGISDTFDITKCRYHKIIIMADADSDGAHITTLHITFFYRFLRPLIEAGYLYVAVPPLFKVTKGKEVTYLYSREELEAFDTEGASIQRYKGLGEMNADQIWDTTMNPEVRKLIQITIEDAEEADDALSLCMGDNVEARKEFISENAYYAI